MHAVGERRRDAEVPAATTKRPEQLGLTPGIYAPQPPIGGNHLRGHHRVGRQPISARQPAHTTAKGVADHADVVGRAGQRDQPVGGGGTDDVGPHGARSDPCELRGWINGDLAHVAGPDQQRVGKRSERRGVVPGALHGDTHPSRGSPSNSGRKLQGRARQGDRRRTLINGQVPRDACTVIVRISGIKDRNDWVGGVHRGRHADQPLPRQCDADR